MSYQALYRVWRPQTFDELVGQPVITETLKNAIINQQTSHAYLFTGPRGTGKTSAAKIFAKAINCPHQTGGNPCNECEICRAINQGQLSDVVEIDAASNNGVDEIRSLRDNVRYAASQTENKVYIIDEVHMLTTGAFNALLKTLEEPPERVIFILATTEPHKIPATIISRTQRFDFQRITQKHLVNRMIEILDNSQIQYQIDALEVIARAANGGMRDSLSLLDQALSYRSEALTLEAALEVSGSLSQLAFVDYLMAIYQEKGDQALEILDQQLQKGKQASRFVEELILFARDILLTIYADVNQTLLSSQELEPLNALIEPDFYYYLIDQLSDVQNKMRLSSQTDLYLEVLTIQLAQKGSGSQNYQKGLEDNSNQQNQQLILQMREELSRLKAQVSHLEAQMKQQGSSLDTQQNENKQNEVSADFSINQAEEKAPTKENFAPRPRPQFAKAEYNLVVEDIYSLLNQATHQDVHQVKSAWEDILSKLSPQDRPKFVGVQVLAASPSMMLLSFQSEIFAGAIQQDFAILKDLYKITQALLGKGYASLIIADKDWMPVRNDYTVLRKANQGQVIEISNKVQEKLDAYIARLNKEEIKESEDVSQNALALEASDDDYQEDFELLDDEEMQNQDEIPAHVSKAIELFGEDNINIYYDR